jgi:hypothetical protein
VSLAKRQRDRALSIALEKLLKEGLPIDRGVVADQFKEELPELMGEPFFQLREQVRRGKFRADWQNLMFDETAVDLELLYEQNVEVVETLLGHLALAEVTGRRSGQEIRALQGLLEDLLLTSQRGTNFFYSIFDSFTDLAKTDQVQSDVALDLANGLITLAPEASTKRLTLPHLLEQTTAPVSVIAPTNGARGAQVPGTKFGHAFEDLLTAWQYQVTTDTQETVEISLTIPVVDTLAGQGPEIITRIQLHALSATPFTVMPLWAKDGVAFSQFENISEPLLVEDDVITIDFAPQTVTALQLRLKKTGPDTEEESSTDRSRKFATVFGFRQISLWKMGYRRNGVFYSQALSPQDAEDLPNISKVTLAVDEIVPAGTQIRYAIATNAAPTSFIPITPLGRADGEAPQVVDFATTQRSNRDENPFTIDASSPAVSLGRVRGTEFFSLAGLTDPTIFQTAKLWRGKNAWHCKREVENNIRSVRNLYLDFGKSNVQRLYVFEEEERIATHPANAAGSTAIEVEVRYPILLESDTFQPGQDLQLPTDVSRPNYSIRRLMRRPVAGSLTQTQATGDLDIKSVASTGGAGTAGRAGATISIANFTGATLVPAVEDGTGAVPDLVGIPFRISYVVGGVMVAGTFTTTAAQVRSDQSLSLQVEDPTEILRDASGTLAALSATWEILSVNITRAITSVVGNVLTLDRGQKLNTEDLLEITYRRSLLPVETPVTSSLVVKSATTGGTTYTQGVDFTLDLGTRTLSRIPTGGIGTSGAQSSQAVRVDFDFEEEVLGLVTYRSFVFNSQPTPKLTLEKVAVDRESGEQILFQASGGFLDLHDRDDLPPLSEGWHQVVVRSRPIRRSDNTIDKESAIYKAINLKEIRSAADTGRFLLPVTNHPDATGTTTDIFSGYFTRQQSTLQPLQQVTWTQFSTSVRKTDRTVFTVKAADEGPVTATAAIVTNFDPETTTDRLYFPPDITGTGIPLDREDFEFEYSFTPTIATSLTSLILRATLDRSPDTEGSRTPILKSYTLRLSF